MLIANQPQDEAVKHPWKRVQEYYVLFLTVHINWTPCIQKLELVYSELNYIAVYGVWWKWAAHFLRQSGSQTSG